MCRHCGWPGRYPNVDDANDPAERTELDHRYQAAMTESVARGSDQALKDFEAAAADSKAVLARSSGDLLRLANSDSELYATFYELIEGGMRAAAADEWEFRRRVADAALFPGYFKDIRFAALSLDGIGLSTFGSCSIVLRNDMIAHRASVLEENSVLFAERHRVATKKGKKPRGTVPPGYRGTWPDRGKVSAAKLHKSIDAGTGPAEYSGLLMHLGATSEEHEFVEAHIFGTMTVRTIEQVSVPKRRKSADNVNIKKLAEELRKFGVAVKFR
ncbi:MAG: hypothetical protein AABO41_22430 [Acidobacteriota bacterium]